MGLEELAKLVRYYILTATTEAGSGHPTSSLSAVELMTALFFDGFFRFDAKNPNNPNNDRLIFSKGHASPLLYAMWAAAGAIDGKELMTLRKFGSRLEGHPTPTFPYAEAATGSLGQGLSVGVGMALNATLDRLPYRTFVLLGDSEMTEGSQWEAIQFAAYHKMNNLIGIIDVNRLGQRGETMYGHNLDAYRKRISAFDWNAVVIDGHSFPEIANAYKQALSSGIPTMIIAKTLKGKGVSFIEDKDGWHGKALKKDELERALEELGDVDKTVRGRITEPEEHVFVRIEKKDIPELSYQLGSSVATRKAYGNALARIYPAFPEIVVLDAEVGNSTFSEFFKNSYPDRSFEMFVAEQNMVGTALGLARRGKIPFVSSFAAFLTRAFDQIRMSAYSDANIKFCGSHAGVSIGEDGASQMGLEDMALFRSVMNGVVLYSCDAVSTERLVEEAARHTGIVYLRTTRKETPVIYSQTEMFPVGGSKTLRNSSSDRATIVSAGTTLHEALNAYEELKNEGIPVRVIDLYSIKPLDEETLMRAARETKTIITVEDHYAEGGLGEAVMSALAYSHAPVYQLAVRKMPRSGKPEELLDYEGISSAAIVRKVKELLYEN